MNRQIDLQRHSGDSYAEYSTSRLPLYSMDRHSGVTEQSSLSDKGSKFDITLLWRAPTVNPITGKGRSIPVLNPINLYGRVFHFAWFGFFVAFWSWYAFPPLLTMTIAKDLGLSSIDIMNSNIVALLGTLIIRLTAGLACDRFGARYTFAAILLVGSIPTVLAGTVTNAAGLIALRFFVGILGGAFVPCQVWTTGFFDKNCVGTANALTAGWGNAGGGITYFIMPAILDSLVYNSGYTPHVAWRVAFVIPFIVIVVTALAMVVLCPDTPLPQGNWGARHQQVQRRLAAQGLDASIVSPPGIFKETQQQRTERYQSVRHVQESKGTQGAPTSLSARHAPVETTGAVTSYISSHDTKKHLAELRQREMMDAGRGEVVQAPSRKEAVYVIWSTHTFVLMASYFCSFGAELAVNSVLGAYYLQKFVGETQTTSGRWAAMFGLLNLAARPLGGLASDLLYSLTGTLWARKYFMHGMGLIAGGFLLALGLQTSMDSGTTYGLVAGTAIFIEAGNGATFALLPHVHPFANGIMAGLTGAAGNLGGIIFAVIFRANGANYNQVFWILGAIVIIVNLAVSWIRPIPVGQIGGR